MKTYKLLLKQAVLVLAIPLFIFTSCDKPSEFTSDEDLELKKGKLKIKTPSYEFTEWTGDLPTPCKQVCLVAGQHMNVGNVNVAVVAEGVLVTYEIIGPDIYINEIHLDIFLNEGAFKAAKKISGGGAIPGKFEYKLSWGTDEQITTHSVVIPNEYIQSITVGEDCFYIASHASLSNGETAWGGICNASDKGVTLVDALQFPGRNWSVYFKFCMDDCAREIDFTYAWEDLRDEGNDGDYNDLVIQSIVTKKATELKVEFRASARGAAADHAFKIKVPKLGVTGISDDNGYTSDASFYYITVFPHTKAALQPYDDPKNYGIHGWSYNTSQYDTDCDPIVSHTITLSIDGDFLYDENKPYEPFITVLYGFEYDLYVYEVSGPGSGSWINPDDGKEYPNGIIIPNDWKWPLERTYIKVPYPDFPNITDGWTTTWADNLVNSGATWSSCD